MKQLRMAFMLFLLLPGWAACSSGHLGSNIIAFLRNGQLWTIEPNGANAFAFDEQSTPVVGYAWSPNHQLLTFRALDIDFAKTSAARHLASNAITGQVGDIPSTTNTIGVDGGTPITVAFSSPDVRYNSATWNTTGTRLLYRQTATNAANTPMSVQWWVSQNDQPGGIAIKSLPATYSIPSLSYESIYQEYMAIGNSDTGIFTTTLAGTHLTYLQHSPLAGHPLSASLERLLWQPAHGHTHVLYALPDTTGNTHQDIQLVLRSLDGQTTTIAHCACTQFAWSPDGNHILYSTGLDYIIVNILTHTSFTIRGAAESVPYWSPDSQFLVLDGVHKFILVKIATTQKDTLLSDTSTTSVETTTGSLPGTTALLQPGANSIWSADSRHFLFLTRQRLLWQGHLLSKGRGLYTITIDNAGHPIGAPISVDTGNDTQAGWTYQDPNTSFLF